ncbi:MAG: 2-polyprenyl-3-methyl-6-methoxy-1,4-benzoquinone monooxygenase [Pseudomonadales bacterium]|nr:2-polyprenyl-3-methyl-6-methoxy-1,4-benzoquinone monooxygenase [Pseudomonadales bacterium]MCP5184368.1 2-polyprenyl-3-methyl-6-methoxy-1,4-benzoquinone monooxygenase [Pseudomonadales bacterium]
MTTIDQLIVGFDRGLRTVFGPASGHRPNPAADLPEACLDETQRRHAAGLMRINHTGEICAQALYEGQAMAAEQPSARAMLLKAADEEADHLAWCGDRLRELDSRPSVLNPLFYAASWCMGLLTGKLGDRVSLGFVEATEERVGAHLTEHLETLPESDLRSRAIVTRMRTEEAEHGATALRAGGASFPVPVRRFMWLLSRVMTASTYRI